MTMESDSDRGEDVSFIIILIEKPMKYLCLLIDRSNVMFYV